MRMNWIAAPLAALALVVAAWAGYNSQLGPTGHDTHKQLVVIKPGSGVSAIAHQLEHEGLIKSAWAFSIYLRTHGSDRTIKAGMYALAPAMGARGVADVLVEGRGENRRVTVPEGFSIRQIAEALDERQPGSGARFAALAGDANFFAPRFPFLAKLPAGASLEGFLFPDTYVIAPEPGYEADLIDMMLTRFSQVVLPAYEAAATHRLDLVQTVTMASIVEKEARHPEERPRIAGVFYNRLAAHIPLGSDPTVEYALHKHQGANGLSLRDVAVDSPYNTYKYAGLPPGPIANPGLASIQAALGPDTTPFLYFVARGDGSHAFTRTYAEHLAAQRQIIAARRGR